MKAYQITRRPFLLYEMQAETRSGENVVDVVRRFISEAKEPSKSEILSFTDNTVDVIRDGIKYTVEYIGETSEVAE